MNAGLQRWLAAHEEHVVLALLGAGAVLRTLLVLASPTSFGYVWDYYHDGVRILFNEGRLPIAEDCWQCAHPPLFYLLGWPWYALGWLIGAAGDETLALRLTAGLAMPAAAVVIYYGYRLLRLFGCRGASLVSGLALLLVCPALFISSYGAEADIVLSALLSAFIYYLTRYAAHPSAASPWQVLLIGVLAGLAAATKYSGLVALASAGVVFAMHLARGPHRRLAVQHGLVVLVVCTLIGGWKYVDNIQRYGTPLFANGSSAQGLALSNRGDAGGRYEFTTLRLRALSHLFGPRAPRGELTTFDVYYSVPTTMHALVWSDMSFFSVRSRHGSEGDPYPPKRIPVSLTMSLIVLGSVPELLAILGAIVTLRRRAFRPLVVFSVITLGAYVWWVIPQATWALKPKYILCLLPCAALFMAVGHAWLVRRSPWIGGVATVLMAALIVVAHVYLYAFAVGRL